MSPQKLQSGSAWALLSLVFLLWPIQMFFERQQWCLNSSLIGQLLYINSEGVSRRTPSCSGGGWVKASAPAPNEVQRLRLTLDQIHRLKILEGLLGEISEPLTLILREDQPFTFSERGRILELGGEWLSGPQFQEALIYAWLGQPKENPLIPLERELLAGFWQRFLDGHTRSSPGALPPYWLSLKSLNTYCFGDAKSPRHMNYCQKHNSQPRSEFSAASYPHIWSLLPYLQDSLWQFFRAKKLIEKGQFLSRWKDEVDPWLSGLREISSEITLDPLPLELSLQARLRSAMGKLPPTPAITWLQWFEPLSPPESKALWDWAGGSAEAGLVLISPFQGSSIPENSGRRRLVPGAEDVIHLHTGRPVEFFSRLEVDFREQIWLSCKAPSRQKLLNARAQRVHWVEHCPKVEPVKPPRWSRLAFQTGWTQFLQTESHLNFITFHPDSVRLTYHLNSFAQPDQGSVSDMDFWKAALGWEKIGWSKKFQYFTPQAKIDGVIKFRLEMTGNMRNEFLVRALPVIDVNRRSGVGNNSSN